MPPDNNNVPRVRTGPIDWLTRTTREALERAITGALGREWQVKFEQDFSEFACHPVGIVSNGSQAFFFKLGETTEACRQFEVEAKGLQALNGAAGVLTPEIIGVEPVETGWLMIMKAVETVERGSSQWREIGRTLAQIHRVRGKSFGYTSNGFWGPLPQDNTSGQDWISFFEQRRLRPLLKTAADSGNLPPDVVSRIENLFGWLPNLGGPDVTPVLVHGDAQQNNFISSPEGTYVIDPAVFYGHPEWDLALVDSWQPVPEQVFEGYREVLPIAPDFEDRRHLWRLPLYLAAVALEGPMHLQRLTDSLKRIE